MRGALCVGLILLLTGCSNRPVADLLDYFCSPRLDRGAPPGRGGVCDPVPVITAPPPGTLPPAAVAVPPAGAPIIAPGAAPPIGPAVPPPPDPPMPPMLP